MTRLKRTAAGQAVYDFTSAWWVNVFTVDDFGNVDEEMYYSSEDVFAAGAEFENLMKMADEYLAYDMPGMAEVLNDGLDVDEQVVKEVKIELNEDACHWTLTTTRELTDAEIEKLKDEILGQNSDGIGEGLEQQDIEGESRREMVENEDGEMEECVHTEYAHVELWRGDRDNVVECTKIG